jgi:hypothetical protein
MDLKGDADAAMIDGKMSKSRPETCIFIHDSRSRSSEAEQRLLPPEGGRGEPHHRDRQALLMRDPLTVARPAKYGGDVSYQPPRS